MKGMVLAGVIAVLLSGCSDPEPEFVSGRHPADIGAGPATTVSEAERKAKGLPPGPGRTLPPETTTTVANRPPVAGGTGNTAPPPAPAAEPDLFERRTKAEGTRVVSGSNARVEWRLYAWQSDKNETCLGFYSATHSFDGGNSGGAVMCKQRPPLDVSTSRSAEGSFVFGLTAPEVVRVRVEHAEGAAETFDTVSAPGFQPRFYAGEVAATPVKRVVGLDANGKVIAEKDMSTYNQPVPD